MVNNKELGQKKGVENGNDTLAENDQSLKKRTLIIF